MKLTVIMRNEVPMIFANDPPTHRSIAVPLTDEQIAMIKPRKVGVNMGKDIYEDIAACFIEEEG